MPGERRRAGRWRWLKLNGGQMTGVSAPVATRRRKGRSSRKELRRTVVQGETDADGLHCGGRREPGWTLLLYTGYDNEACPLSWAGPSVPCGETTDWRAGCGKSASPVRREGAAKAAPYPYRKSMSTCFLLVTRHAVRQQRMAASDQKSSTLRAKRGRTRCH